jgi:hypothetical protein
MNAFNTGCALLFSVAMLVLVSCGPIFGYAWWSKHRKS